MAPFLLKFANDMKPLQLLILTLTATIVSGLSFTSCRHNNLEDVNDDMLMRLDSALTVKDKLLVAKQRKIDQIRHTLYDAESVSKRYDIYDQLYNQYYTFNFDSAALYASRKTEMAREMNDDYRYRLSELQQARVQMLLGDEIKSRQHLLASGIDSVTVAEADPSLALAYYNLMANHDEVRGRFNLKWYRSIKKLLPEKSADWIYTRVNELRATGRNDMALTLIHDNRALLDSTPHNRAITLYIEGQLKLLTGDTIGAINNYIQSSYYDITTPVRDYKSLYELAALLLSQGDVNRAYRYISAAIVDGNAAKVASNTMAVNALIPDILAAHERNNLQNRRTMIWVSVCITILSVVLAAMLYTVIKSRNKVHSINEKLASVNEQLKASNSVKDAYLVQYLNLCSYFLNSLEQFRTNVSSTLRTKGTAGLERLLAKTDDDRELKKFYANFDETFLKLFPDFVEKFNTMVRPDCRVSLTKEGGMTNELRTFALIRLGITDSAQIASFLHRSVSTVYNYRVKMRNAALGDRDRFEAQISTL